jgi:hypothetical protein
MNWRRAVHGLIGLILLAGAVVAVGLVLLFYQGEPPASRETLAPAQVQAAEQKVRSLEEAGERIAEAVKAHRPTPFTLRVRDAELNTYFAAHPEAVRALNPDLRWAEFEFGTGGTVSFRGVGTYQGREVLLRLKGEVRLDPNQGPSFTLQEGHLGALPLPAGLRRKLAAEINRSLSQELKKLPPQVRIESLAVESGELTLQGRVTAGEG